MTHASHQLSHVVNRMFTTLESKGILRMATEEFMLAASFHRWDSLSSEFIRSCREANFYGRAFLERVEAIASHQENLTLTTILPGNKKSMVALDIVSLYGVRPPLPWIWYSSPFEFCQWFFIHRLRPPSQGYNLTSLTAAGRRKRLDTSETLLPGKVFVFNVQRWVLMI